MSRRPTQSRRPAPVRIVVALAVVLGVLVPASSAEDLSLPGRPDPGLAAAFLPRHAPPGAYQLSVLDLPIEAARDRLMATLAPAAKVNEPAGAWTIARAAELLDAFGDVGVYSRSRLSRLYAGRPVRVLRAPIVRSGRVVASLTLVSPHPDAGLTRLESGTMAILFLVDKARATR